MDDWNGVRYDDQPPGRIGQVMLDPSVINFENVPGIKMENTARLIAESRWPGFQAAGARYVIDDADPPREYWRVELWKVGAP